jgi:hypothetical protein
MKLKSFSISWFLVQGFGCLRKPNDGDQITKITLNVARLLHWSFPVFYRCFSGVFVSLGSFSGSGFVFYFLFYFREKYNLTPKLLAIFILAL